MSANTDLAAFNRLATSRTTVGLVLDMRRENPFRATSPKWEPYFALADKSPDQPLVVIAGQPWRDGVFFCLCADENIALASMAAANARMAELESDKTLWIANVEPDLRRRFTTLIAELQETEGSA